MRKLDLDHLTPEDVTREHQARQYYMDLAAKGDAEAKLTLKAHPRWRVCGLYNREKGGVVIGEHLWEVARVREAHDLLAR